MNYTTAYCGSSGFVKYNVKKVTANLCVHLYRINKLITNFMPKNGLLTNVKQGEIKRQLCNLMFDFM